MGIPIGWNIKREEAKEKDVLRDDLTGARSPIRRRARTNRASRTSIAEYFTNSASTARAPHQRARLAPPPVPELSRSTSDAVPDTATESTRAQHRPPHRTVDANDYSFGWTVEEVGSDDERPLPALTPGFAPADSARLAGANTRAARRDWARERPSVNPRMRVTRSRSPTRIERFRSARTGYSLDPAEDDHEDTESNAVSFPPLRRMGRRTIADGPLPSSLLRESWSPPSLIDGLGDRERSVSPSAWNTFDSTVVPDPVAPTAESSFASAAASASFSNSHPSSRAGSSNSAASSRTHLTVPSRRGSRSQIEQFMRACDTSEDDSASDTEEEEMDVRGSIRLANATESARNRQDLSNPLRRRMRPSYFSDDPPRRDYDRYSSRVLERSREAGAYVRRYYYTDFGAPRDDTDVERPLLSQLDGPIEEPSTTGEDEAPSLVRIDSPPSDRELRDARSLLERLTRDPDVNDDFWASVGLTRSFADPVERFQERERQ